MKVRLLALLCAVMMTLSGCTAQEILLPATTLPPMTSTVSAPVGDASLSMETTAALYLPSLDGQRLICLYEPVSLNRGRHPAEAVVKALLNHAGNDLAAPLGGRVNLYLSGYNPVELSGGVCTVNLGSSALQLEEEKLYTVSLALAATLCELPGIHSVNILVGGQSVGLDVSGTLPMGVVTPRRDAELPVLWAQMSARRTPVGAKPTDTPLSSAATLYFPLADASGVVPETRSLDFAGQSPVQLAQTLLAALSSGPRQISGTALLPDMDNLLIRLPELHALSDGGQMLTLHFLPSLESTLREHSVDLACFAAALTLTLTTYIPSLTSVQLLTGSSALTSVYNPALGSQLFPGGVMRREHFGDYVRQSVTLYMVKGNGLTAVQRSMADESAFHPRQVLLTLLAGPSQSELNAGCTAALPSGLSDADVLGVSIDGDTLLLNLSARFAQAIRDSSLDQQFMARSLTSTLCSCTSTRRLRIFFGGQAFEDLGGNVCWSGEFLLTSYLTEPVGGE